MLRNACCENLRGDIETVNENCKDKHFFPTSLRYFAKWQVPLGIISM